MSAHCHACGAQLLRESVTCSVIELPLTEVIDDLSVELETIYHNRWNKRWLGWTGRKGGVIMVKLLKAAAYWEANGRINVAERLRARERAEAGRLAKEAANQ